MIIRDTYMYIIVLHHKILNAKAYDSVCIFLLYEVENDFLKVYSGWN